MRTILASLLLVLFYSSAYGQKVAELYNAKNYAELVKFEKAAGTLTPDELYMVGFAFFQQSDDEKAVKFYDLALRKGLAFAYVYYDKALALRYARKYEESIKSFDLALAKEPDNQRYLSEKGLAHYHAGDYDKALAVFRTAQKLPMVSPTPFYMVPHIQHLTKEYEQALPGFYEALKHLPSGSDYYRMALADIGKLEFTVTKDFAKSARAYSQAIALDGKKYELYPKLIKAYNAGKQYARADSVFNLMRVAFQEGKLPEDDMKFKNTAVEEYEWNGRKLSIHKYFTAPKDMLDISYKIYLLDKKGEAVERVFMVEKTLKIGDGAQHLLCEKVKSDGSHVTYPYGWSADEISLEELKKGVGLVLDGTLTKSASSNFGRK